MVETKEIEKYFKTEVVASYIEVCYLGEFEYSEIFDFASFITGIDINMSNIATYRNIIMEEINKQYPLLKRNIYLSNGCSLNKYDIKDIKDIYTTLYGHYMLFKSKQKETYYIMDKPKKLKLKNK